MNEIRKRLDNRMPLTWRQGVLLVSEVERLEIEIGHLKHRISVIGNTGSPCACSWEPGADGELQLVKWCAFHSKAAVERHAAEAVRG